MDKKERPARKPPSAFEKFVSAIARVPKREVDEIDKRERDARDAAKPRSKTA